MFALVRNSALGALLALATGCSGSGSLPAKPQLPRSAPPGWTQQTFAETPNPAGLPPAQTSPKCWLAVYSGPGSADVTVCGYAAEASAFDAGQRFPIKANSVKFQQRQWLVLVSWSGASQTDITSLVRTINRALEK